MQATSSHSPSDGSASLISHLEALRTMLIRMALLCLIGAPIGLIFAPKVISILVRHCFGESGLSLHYFSLMEPFLVQLKMGITIGIVLTFPLQALCVWRFIAPALYSSEKRIVRSSVAYSSILFASGAAFCTILILPLITRFSISFSNTELTPMFGIESFISLCATLMLAFGIMFQMPLLITLLVRFGILSSTKIKHLRPYIIVIILIISAFLTPPDVFSQLLLAIPTWILFELGLLFARR